MARGVYESRCPGASGRYRKKKLIFQRSKCHRQLGQLDRGAQLDLVEHALEGGIAGILAGAARRRGEVGKGVPVGGALDQAELKRVEAVEHRGGAGDGLAAARGRIGNLLEREERADAAG